MSEIPEAIKSIFGEAIKLTAADYETLHNALITHELVTRERDESLTRKVIILKMIADRKAESK